MAAPTLRLFDGFKHTHPELREEVKALQRALKEEGFRLRVDGRFGRGTEGAVQAFQQARGLDDDGIVGVLTWAALRGEAAPDAGHVFETTYASNNRSLLDQLEAVAQYRAAIEEGAGRYKVQPCVVAGIGSRESHWGLALTPTGPVGTGDFAKRPHPARHRDGGLPPDGGGFGRGLMQIDYDAHSFAREGHWQDPRANILYGCQVLHEAMAFMRRKTELAGHDLLRAAIAAYNCGSGNALKAQRAGRDIDYYTAGRDYSADVLNRAGFFQNNGWE